MAEKKAAKIAKRTKKRAVKKYDDKIVLPVRLFIGGKNKMCAYYEKGEEIVTNKNGANVLYKEIPSFFE